MKKIIYAIFTIALLFSCSVDDNDLILGEEGSDSKGQLKQAADGKYDLLGFSYDVTGDYLHVDEARYTVLNIASFVQDNPGRYYYPASTIGDVKTYSGATATDFLEDIQTKASVKTGVSVGKVFTGSITKKKEYQTKYSYSSKYSFSRGDVVKRVKRLYLDADVAMLSKYVTQEFKDNLAKYPADKFVEMYGTHVLTDITIGGRLTFTYSSAITEESNYSRKKEISEAGLSFAIGSYGADRQKSHEKETVKQLNTKNAAWKTTVNYHGGEGSGVSITYNAETGYPSTTFNIDNWEKSVNATNAALVDINWNKAYFIYDFISDPTKKQQIKTAVENYIVSKQITLLDIVPFHGYYHSKLGDHYYTDVWRPNYGYDGYINEGVQFYVFNKQEQGTIPLYIYYFSQSNRTDHYYTTVKKTYSGYIYEKIACYIYPNQVEGTIPLYVYYNSGNSDHYYSTLKKNYSGYVYEQIVGYIYPAN